MSSITVDQYEGNYSGTVEIFKDYHSRYRQHRHLRHLKKCSMMKLVVYKTEAKILSRNTTPDAAQKLQNLKPLYLDEVGHLNVLLQQITACRLDLHALRHIIDTRRVVPEYYAAVAAQARYRKQYLDPEESDSDECKEN